MREGRGEGAGAVDEGVAGLEEERRAVFHSYDRTYFEVEGKDGMKNMEGPLNAMRAIRESLACDSLMPLLGRVDGLLTLV